MIVPAPTRERERGPAFVVMPPKRLRVAPEEAETTEAPPPEVTVTTPLTVLLPEMEAMLP